MVVTNWIYSDSCNTYIEHIDYCTAVGVSGFGELYQLHKDTNIGYFIKPHRVTANLKLLYV